MTDREPRVPPVLAGAAAWCWRLIVVGVVVYTLVRVLDMLHLVVLPCAVAVLLCALLNPITARLRRWMPPLAATWLTMLIALGVLGGVGTFVGIQANDQFPHLLDRIQRTATDVQRWLVTGPLHLKSSQLQSMVNGLLDQLQRQRGKLFSTAFTGATVAGEVIASMVFLFFVTFFLLKDGAGIWRWLISGMGAHRARADRAGRAAWETLSQYVHGTVIVAAIHSVVIAVTLIIIGVPLVAPLAVIVFFGSFIPIVGILVAGAVAVIVVFSFKGLVATLVFLGILVLEQQLEGHVLQPLVVGRWVRFHPLAIILAISVGGVVGGIPGAAVAVPTAAVIYRAWPALRHDPPEPSTAPGGPGPPGGPPDGPDGVEGPGDEPAAGPGTDDPGGDPGADAADGQGAGPGGGAASDRRGETTAGPAGAEPASALEAPRGDRSEPPGPRPPGGE